MDVMGMPVVSARFNGALCVVSQMYSICPLHPRTGSEVDFSIYFFIKHDGGMNRGACASASQEPASNERCGLRCNVGAGDSVMDPW